MKELQIIQAKLKVPKDNSTKFYKFRNLEDINEKVKPLLDETGCTLTLSDEIVMLGDRFYVKATATLKNSTGEVEITTGYAREEEKSTNMQQAQLTGSSSSYARKYALNGLFCLDDTKCDDAMKQMEEKMEATIRERIATEQKGSVTTTTHQNVQPATNLSIEDVINKCMLAKSNNELLWIHKEYYESGIYQTPELLKALSERKTQLQNLESL